MSRIKDGYSFKELGALSSNQVWVYLCGLVKNFNADEMEELKVLQVLGKKYNIKFLAIVPKERCAYLNNSLCWPQDSQEELLDTYRKILNSLHHYKIQGYIGFSNGGFFLNKLVQFVELDTPIISVGSAGKIINNTGPKNNIYLLIGKDDQWHYEPAVNFYKASKNSNLTINFIEYQNGHLLPLEILSDTLKNIMQQS